MEQELFEALRNEKFVLGESVHKFEEEFAKYCGTTMQYQQVLVLMRYKLLYWLLVCQEPELSPRLLRLLQVQMRLFMLKRTAFRISTWTYTMDPHI